MDINIKITGGGNENDIVKALRSIAQSIANGDHIDILEDGRRVVWEDADLLTVITD